MGGPLVPPQVRRGGRPRGSTWKRRTDQGGTVGIGGRTQEPRNHSIQVVGWTGKGRASRLRAVEEHNLETGGTTNDIEG